MTEDKVLEEQAGSRTDFLVKNFPLLVAQMKLISVVSSIRSVLLTPVILLNTILSKSTL